MHVMSKTYMCFWRGPPHDGPIDSANRLPTHVPLTPTYPTESHVSPTGRYLPARGIHYHRRKLTHAPRLGSPLTHSNAHPHFLLLAYFLPRM